MRRLIAMLALLPALAFAQDAAPLLMVMDVPDPYLLVWYKLDGNAGDSSINKRPGTWGGTEGYTNGVYGQAAVFLATNIITRATDFGITDQLTLTAWVKATTSGATYPRIVGAEGKWILYILLGKLRFAGSGLDWTFLDSPDIRDDAWHHVACVYDGDGIDGYVDGVGVGTINKTGSLTAQSGIDLTIGNRADLTRGLAGLVDDVRLFNRALSSNDIVRIKNNLTPLHD